MPRLSSRQAASGGAGVASVHPTGRNSAKNPLALRLSGLIAAASQRADGLEPAPEPPGEAGPVCFATNPSIAANAAAPAAAPWRTNSERIRSTATSAKEMRPRWRLGDMRAFYERLAGQTTRPRCSLRLLAGALPRPACAAPYASMQQRGYHRSGDSRRSWSSIAVARHNDSEGWAGIG